jgi:ubiquitin-protein ligase
MTLFERRLRAEWQLLHELAAKNPGRLVNLKADDSVFYVTLRETPGLRATASALNGERVVDTEHKLRFEFPVHYPAVPLMLYLEQPVLHPNIHPENGFVCLWSQHRVSNTLEHAIHKTVAMLGCRLFNDTVPHVMQPDALTHLQQHREELALELRAEPLIGITHAPDLTAIETTVRRRRLS